MDTLLQQQQEEEYQLMCADMYRGEQKRLFQSDIEYSAKGGSVVFAAIRLLEYTQQCREESYDDVPMYF